MHYREADGQRTPLPPPSGRVVFRVPGLVCAGSDNSLWMKITCSPFCSFPCSPGPWSSHLVQGMVTQHSSSLLLLLLITAIIKSATTYPIPCCIPGSGLGALHVLTCLILTMTLWKGYKYDPIYSWSARLGGMKDQRGQCKGRLWPVGPRVGCSPCPWPTADQVSGAWDPI